MLKTTRFETHDRDEAIAAFAAMSGAEPPTIEGRGAVTLRAAWTATDSLVAAVTEIGTAYRGGSPAADDLRIMSGTSAWAMDVGGAEYAADAGQMLRPPSHRPLRFIIPRGVFGGTTIRGDVVREVARDAFVDAPTSLDPDVVRPVSPAMEQLWGASISVYRQHILRPEMYENRLIRDEATRSLVTTAIVAFGLHRPAERAAVASLAARRARSYIDENFHRALTIHEIATAARLSVRGLQYAFQHAYGESPMAYLRSARLSAVRHDLLGADAMSGATVSEIAHRRGFAHLGRFAATYRTAFGETPRETLLRS